MYYLDLKKFMNRSIVAVENYYIVNTERSVFIDLAIWYKKHSSRRCGKIRKTFFFSYAAQILMPHVYTELRS